MNGNAALALVLSVLFISVAGCTVGQSFALHSSTSCEQVK